MSDTPHTARFGASLAGLILLVCVGAMILAGMGLFGPRPAAPGAHAKAQAAEAASALPPGPPPAVEPLIVREIAPDDARAINAAVPFVSGPIPPAPPFKFAGDAGERERAITCLAAATWYEAGDDAIGQQAVAQVVLNRMRHPAYPKSVCGVVFQGAERKTGCQFTFTCDGALTRRPSEAAWKRAREIAVRALSGFVVKAVGTATHYHTDWVVPYWSATLDKIAEVHTHLFFRWRGGWGQPAALTRRYQGPEPIDPRIVFLADAKLVPPGSVLPTAPGALAAYAELPPEPETLFIPGVPTTSLKGSTVRLMDTVRHDYALQLDPAAFPGSYAVVAVAICKDKPACTVAGWTDPARVPQALPMPQPLLRSASFLYRRIGSGREDIFWNCRQFARENKAQCLPGTDGAPAAPPAVPAAPVPPPATQPTPTPRP